LDSNFISNDFISKLISFCFSSVCLENFMSTAWILLLFLFISVLVVKNLSSHSSARLVCFILQDVIDWDFLPAHSYVFYLPVQDGSHISVPQLFISRCIQWYHGFVVESVVLYFLLQFT
jgi:hypothetical protein